MKLYYSSGSYLASLGAALGLPAVDCAGEDWVDDYGCRTERARPVSTVPRSSRTPSTTSGVVAARLCVAILPLPVWRRTGHVLEMTFLTYDQHGRERLDPPQLVGAYGSGMLSTYWYPKGFSPLVRGCRRGTCRWVLWPACHGPGVHSGDQAHVATPQDVQHKLGKKQLKSLQNIMAAQRQ